MIDWDSIDQTIHAWIESVTEIHAEAQDGPRTQPDPETEAVFRTSWISVVEVGTRDFRRYEEADPPAWGEPWGTSPDLTETTSSPQECTLRILCESYSQAPNRRAAALLSKLRGGLGWTSTGQILASVDVAYLRVAGYGDLPTTYDDRVFSAGYLDVVFSVTAEHTDPQTLDRIESAEVRRV